MTQKPTIKAVAAVLQCNRSGRLLIARRPPGKPLAGQWEFPGGKPQAGESEAAALARELHEELGLTLSSGHLIRLRATIQHEFPDFHVHVPLYKAIISPASAQPKEGQELAWVPPPGLLHHPDILPGIRGVLPALLAELTPPPNHITPKAP